MLQLVIVARSRLARLETDYTKEKSRFDAGQAGLFRHLGGHYYRRDQLRLVVDYRQKFLDSFVRDNTDEVEQSVKDFKEAKAQLDEDYERMAAAAKSEKPMAARQEAKLALIWKKLVKLFHPDGFARQVDKLESYHRLIAALNQSRDDGDIETLRLIAEDPQGFLSRQSWANLDFKDAEKPAQLKRLHEALQKEIAAVTASLGELHASPDYELCRLAGQKPDVLEELAAKRAKQLEVENAELESQAEQLEKEISGKKSSVFHP